MHGKSAAKNHDEYIAEVENKPDLDDDVLTELIRESTGLPAYAGVRLGAGVLTLLPVRLSLWLARIAGRLAYHLDGRHHAIATENLRHAYGDSLTPEERERIILGAFLNLTLARRVGCPIVPFFIRRVPGVSRHLMSIRDPIQAIKTGDAKADILQMTQAYTRVFEEMIRKTPEQWLWLHRHWRTRPPEEKEAARLPRHTGHRPKVAGRLCERS